MAVQLPAKYKAVVYDKPGSISTKIEELDMPEPGEGEVLINLTHSSVCHSDIAVMTNSWPILPFPTQAGQVGGHEGVGAIVKMGPSTDSATIKIGDRVGVKWIASVCETCEDCKAGVDNNCSSRTISGYYKPGTFQQYVVAPANYVTPIPDGLDSAVAAPLLCAGLTVYSALRKANAGPGKWVVVMGAGGGLGHLAVQYSARGIGHRVIGIDHSSKKELVTESGATHFLPVDGTADMIEAVKQLTDGIGAHAVIVCTAHDAAYAQAAHMLRLAGRVVCLGIPDGAPKPIQSALTGMVVGKQLQIIGSLVGSRQEAIEVLELAAKGLVKTHIRIEKMDKLTEIFQDMADGKLQGRVVLDLS